MYTIAINIWSKKMGQYQEQIKIKIEDYLKKTKGYDDKTTEDIISKIYYRGADGNLSKKSLTKGELENRDFFILVEYKKKLYGGKSTDLLTKLNDNSLKSIKLKECCFEEFQNNGLIYDENNKEHLIRLLDKILDSMESLDMSKNIKDTIDIEVIVKDAIDNYDQVIFTGAPGTGKTYSVRKYVEEETKEEIKDDKKRFEFVQFHPSYDYTDFVEGLRPVQIKGSEGTTFVKLDGIFKGFCRKVVEANYNELDEVEKKEIKKLLNDNYKNDDVNVEHAIEKISEGKNKYYFIVDEINRADLAKVFGELMFALEEGYRGCRVHTQYENLKTYFIDKDGFAKPIKEQVDNGIDFFENGFFIPKNLKFIGTMNDIDRSVESFDFALRRRFQWIEIKANEIMENSLKEILESTEVNDIVKGIKDMNEAISQPSFGLNHHYHIGPAYFKGFNEIEVEDSDIKNKNKEKLKEIFSRRIEPLIREYTRGRNEKEVDTFINDLKGILIGNSKNEGNDN